jgi:flagellar FlgN protein
MPTIASPVRPRLGGRAAVHSPQNLIESLIDAFETESRLLDELIAVMRRQRGAVGDDDLQAVDDSVFATHRVLATLSEARSRRQTLNRLLGYREDLAIQSLHEALGSRLSAALGAARDRLSVAARNLSAEVAVNRRLLRAALAGDATADPTRAAP